MFFFVVRSSVRERIILVIVVIDLTTKHTELSTVTQIVTEILRHRDTQDATNPAGKEGSIMR